MHSEMLFYLIHHLNHYVIPWKQDARDGQKNVLTFISGAICYFLLYGALLSKASEARVAGSAFLSILKDFFPYFVIIDAIAMACLYKNYYQRPILCEVGEIATGTVKEYAKTSPSVPTPRPKQQPTVEKIKAEVTEELAELPTIDAELAEELEEHMLTMEKMQDIEQQTSPAEREPEPESEPKPKARPTVKTSKKYSKPVLKTQPTQSSQPPHETSSSKQCDRSLSHPMVHQAGGDLSHRQRPCNASHDWWANGEKDYW